MSALEARDKVVKLAAELVRMSYFEDDKRAVENVRNDMRDLGVRIRQAADEMYARGVPGERGPR